MSGCCSLGCSSITKAAFTYFSCAEPTDVFSPIMGPICRELLLLAADLMDTCFSKYAARSASPSVRHKASCLTQLVFLADPYLEQLVVMLEK